MKRRRMVISGILLLVFGVLLVLGHSRIGVNAWFLLTDSVYVIPAGASMFSFEPTVMNPGSGDWWLYGEDGEHYYHFTGEQPYPVVSYPRKLASECAGFDPVQYATWCVGQGRDALIK